MLIFDCSSNANYQALNSAFGVVSGNEIGDIVQLIATFTHEPLTGTKVIYLLFVSISARISYNRTSWNCSSLAITDLWVKFHMPSSDLNRQ